MDGPRKVLVHFIFELLKSKPDGTMMMSVLSGHNRGGKSRRRKVDRECAFSVILLSVLYRLLQSRDRFQIGKMPRFYRILTTHVNPPIVSVFSLFQAA